MSKMLAVIERKKERKKERAREREREKDTLVENRKSLNQSTNRVAACLDQGYYH